MIPLVFIWCDGGKMPKKIYEYDKTILDNEIEYLEGQLLHAEEQNDFNCRRNYISELFELYYVQNLYQSDKSDFYAVKAAQMLNRGLSLGVREAYHNGYKMMEQEETIPFYSHFEKELNQNGYFMSEDLFAESVVRGTKQDIVEALFLLIDNNRDEISIKDRDKLHFLRERGIDKNDEIIGSMLRIYHSSDVSDPNDRRTIRKEYIREFKELVKCNRRKFDNQQSSNIKLHAV